MNMSDKAETEGGSVTVALPEWRDVVDKAVAWDAISEKNAEIERLRDFVGWVDSWVSNPVGSYSVAALDGLFGMTRDKIAALPLPPRSGTRAGD